MPLSCKQNCGYRKARESNMAQKQGQPTIGFGDPRHLWLSDLDFENAEFYIVLFIAVLITSPIGEALRGYRFDQDPEC